MVKDSSGPDVEAENSFLSVTVLLEVTIGFDESEMWVEKVVFFVRCVVISAETEGLVDSWLGLEDKAAVSPDTG